MAKKVKNVEPEAKESPELEQGTCDEVGDLSYGELVKTENYALAIKSVIVDVEDIVAHADFKAGNPQSHRILSATLVMFKSARDHLGDK